MPIRCLLEWMLRCAMQSSCGQGSMQFGNAHLQLEKLYLVSAEDELLRRLAAHRDIDVGEQLLQHESAPTRTLSAPGRARASLSSCTKGGTLPMGAARCCRRDTSVSHSMCPAKELRTTGTQTVQPWTEHVQAILLQRPNLKTSFVSTLSSRCSVRYESAGACISKIAPAWSCRTCPSPAGRRPYPARGRAA